MSVPGPFMVTQRRRPDDRPFCDTHNVNYGEQCGHRATVRYVGGVNAGRVACTRHANRRSRFAQAIDAPVVVYREAFATLEALVEAIIPRIRAAGIEAADERASIFITPGRRILTLPNGDVIEVEATTYDRRWNQLPAIVRQALPAPPPDLAWERAVLAAWNAEHGIGIGEGAAALVPGREDGDS